MSQKPSPVNHAAASAAPSPSSSELIDAPSPVNHELPVDAEEEVAEQLPLFDVADIEEVADFDDEGADDDVGAEDEYMDVDQKDLRENVECPICLGIIKKCRTMTECLHRFCKVCIEKAMRVGRNECPACRIHCPSRRSFKEDPNFDAIVSLLFPDIEKFEEEEMPFLDEEITRNEQIKAAINETARRQSEATPKRRSSKMMTEGSSSSRSTSKRRKTDANDAEQSSVAPKISAEAENHVLAVDKSPVASNTKRDISSEVVDEEALQMSEERKTLSEFGPNCNHW